MIRFDRTQRSVVVVCDCGVRDVFTSSPAADRWVVDHVRLCAEQSVRDRDRVVASAGMRARRDGRPVP